MGMNYNLATGELWIDDFLYQKSDGANFSIDGNGGTPSTAIVNAPALSIIVSQGNGGGAGGSGILIIEEYQ
jgi:hypothetical protein